MSRFKTGVEALQTAKQKVDLKDAYFQLKKEGDSAMVRVLGVHEFVAYKQHGSYNRGIYSTPCNAEVGEFCPYCVAAKVPEFKDLYAKERILFAFGDIESGTVKLLEVSKNQAQKLFAQIMEYKEEIENAEVAFNLTRTGSGTATSYTLNMLTPKKMQAIKAKFDVFDGVTVSEEFYDERIRPKTPDYMVAMLIKAGFDVEAHFEPALVAEAKELADPTPATTETEEVTEVEEEEDEVPF